MRCKITKLPKSQIEIHFELSAEEFNEYYDKAVFVLSQDVEKEGFRKGKVPREIAEREISSARIMEEAVNLAVRERYVDYILESKIQALGQPEIQVLKLAKNNPLEFKAKVWVLPEVEILDYKSIASKAKKGRIKVEEKEVKNVLLWLQKSRAKFSQKRGACQKGDFVEVSYSSPQLENNKAFQDAFLLGEGSFIPGFEKKLEGMSAGEEKEFSLIAPENFGKRELANKKIDFKTKVNSVKTMELPELSDDWARALGRFENLSALKASIEEGLFQEKETAESQRLRGEILERIARETSIEVPELLIEAEKDKMLADLKARISQSLKISFQDYLQQIKKTENEVVDSFESEAIKRVRNFLILREIANKENIKVSEKEVEEQISEILSRSPDAQEIKELDPERLKVYTEGEIRNEKTLKFLEGLVKS